MADAERLILASGSPFRRQMLQAAGLAFEVHPADIDERSVESSLIAGGDPVDASGIASALAVAKGVAVSNAHPAHLVIGCDQVLGFEGALLHKAESPPAARQQLMRLRGKMHTLHSGICLVRGGKPVWTHVDVACMTMRAFSEGWLEAYMARMGPRLCQTVGGYEIEAEGVGLFERIEGDHFTIIGLPLLPLLAKLRALKVLDA
jgi:septum formation protein